MITFESIGLCRATAYDPDGILGLQPEYLGDGARAADGEEGGGPALAPAHPFGFLIRPRDPEVDGEGSASVGAPLLVAYDGDEGFAMPLNDPRALQLLGELPKGSTALLGHPATGSLLTLLLDAETKRLTASSPAGTTFTLEDGLIKLAGERKIGRVGDRVSAGTVVIAPTVPPAPPGLTVTYTPPSSTTDPSPVPTVFTIVGTLSIAPSPVTILLKGTITEGSEIARAG